MSWQDLTLTVVSLVFIAALIPSVVRRQTAPLSSCLTTGTGLLAVGVVDITLRPPIIYAAATTLITAALWYACAAIAWQQGRTCT